MIGHDSGDHVEALGAQGDEFRVTAHAACGPIGWRADTLGLS